MFAKSKDLIRFTPETKFITMSLITNSVGLTSDRYRGNVGSRVNGTSRTRVNLPKPYTYHPVYFFIKGKYTHLKIKQKHMLNYLCSTTTKDTNITWRRTILKGNISPLGLDIGVLYERRASNLLRFPHVTSCLQGGCIWCCSNQVCIYLITGCMPVWKV